MDRKHRSPLDNLMYPEGTSLDKLVVERRFSLKELISLALKAVKAIRGIHRHDIVHGRIRPQNLRFDSKTRELQALAPEDPFSSSKVFVQAQGHDIMKGTLAYMSPEQTGRIDRAIDYRTDLYSLGIVLYEWFTGRLPIESDDPMEYIHFHIAREPLPPHRINKTVPTAISLIIMKLLEKSPDDRYQSARGLQVDIEECQRQFEEEGRIEDFPLGGHDIPKRFHIPERLYGREREMAVLLEAFDRVSEGGVETVMVSGGPGVGKSVLVGEVRRPIATKGGYFVSGKFDQLCQNIPHIAISAAFKDLVKQLLAESSIRLQEWKDKLIRALGANGRIIIDIIPEVELIIGPKPPLEKLGPVETQNRFNLVFKQFIRALCQKEYPLVIFLDDLQWVDAASLKLIELIMTDEELSHLLLICVYRDNEVGPGHPLIKTIDGREEEGDRIKRITLCPLEERNITRLIADTLYSTEERVVALSKLLFTKADGNPFFTKQMLAELYNESLLRFTDTAEHYGWQWDIEAVRSLDMAEDVIEHLVHRFKRLPDETLNTLRLIACIGQRFDMSTLALITEKKPEELFDDLGVVLEEGLLDRESNHGDGTEDMSSLVFSFQHDRIQEAAYALIEENEKESLHLRIGRLLLAGTDETQLEERVFDIVNQFNKSLALLKDRKERARVVKLNLFAGKKAKSAQACGPAFDYLKSGISLLEEDTWDSAYDITLELHNEAAEAAFLCGHFEEVESIFRIVIQRARTILDKAWVYQRKIQCHMAEGDPRRALITALEILDLLGEKFPESPTLSDIERKLEETSSNCLGNKNKIESLVSLPKMTDSNRLAAMSILAEATAPAYACRLETYILIILRQVNLSIEYGNAEESPFTYAMYSLILTSIMKRIDYGRWFAKLAEDLLKKNQADRFKAKVFDVVYGHVVHHSEHLRGTLTFLEAGYQNGVESGDFEYAGYHALLYSSHAYFSGMDLHDLENKLAAYNEGIKQIQAETAHRMQGPFLQAVLNLVGRSEYPCLLRGDGYDQEKMVPILNETNNKTGLGFLYINSLILCYLFGDYRQAFHSSMLVEENKDGLLALYVIPVWHFYDSLVRLALYASAPKAEQRILLERVASNQKEMEGFAIHAPMNHLHKWHLVEAERGKVLGRDTDTIVEHYECAIDLANEHQYLNEEALAYELAGKFWLEKKRERIARIYIESAHHCYGLWGARAKVKDMEERYPHLLKTVMIREKGYATSAGDSSDISLSESLDIRTLIKASQAISEEIHINRLVTKLMKIIIESAGAGKGFLVLERAGELCIEASADKAKVDILQSIPLDKGHDLPVGIILQVSRTAENVLLHDASNEGGFAHIPYIIKNQPKSILCMPIRYKDNTLGVLYLENNLTTNAFTRDHLQLLKVLLSQAAISLENAMLVEDVRASEEVLKKSDQQFRNIFDGLTTYAGLLQPDGTTVFVNKAAYEIGGVRPEDALGKPFDETWWWSFSEKSKARLRETIERAAQGKASRYDVKVRADDDCFLTIDFSLEPFFDELGKVVYLVLAGLDITARKETEEALRQSEAKYSTLVENALDGIAIVQDGKVKFVNRAAQDLWGYMSDELIDMDLLRIVAPEHRDDAMKMYCDRIAGKGTSSINELSVLKKDNTTTIVEASVSGGMNFLGSPAVFVFARDVSSRKEAEEKRLQLETQLQQAQKMEAVGTLAGGIAHDFNNILMGIQGCTSLMLLDTDPTHPHFEYLKGVETYIKRAADLTNQLLGFARGGKYEIKPTDLNKLVQESSEMFSRTKKEINIYRTYQKEIWTVDADRGQIEQALLNLYVNAWQAMPGGGDLYIETENITLDEPFVELYNVKPGRYVRISVTDKGVGMDEATRQRIFEPFFTTKKMGGGTGLGLASVYGIIKNHGGVIEVFSEKGKGAIFAIYLPASDVEIFEEKRSSDEVINGTGTVLVVDDEQMIIDVNEQLLEAIGYTVLSAQSGRESIEIYKENKERIDLVILDMVMPDMNGREVFDRMREINPDIKVLLSSGYSINGQARDILDRGCDGFIQKPFKMKELSRKIREILDKE